MFEEELQEVRQRRINELRRLLGFEPLEVATKSAQGTRVPRDSAGRALKKKFGSSSRSNADEPRRKANGVRIDKPHAPRRER